MPTKMRKRRVLWPIFSILILLSLILTIFSFLATKSDIVQRKVEEVFTNVVESNLNVQVEIKQTEGNILTGYAFNNITLHSKDGIQLGSAETVSIEFNLFSMLKRVKTFKRILIYEPCFDFSNIPSELLKKKTAEKDTNRKENKTQNTISLQNISIVKGKIKLKSRNKTYSIQNINMEGKILFLPNKKVVYVNKCNASIRYITDIKSFTSTLIFKDGFISFLNCSLKTSNSSVSLSGNLFDDTKPLTVNIKKFSLSEFSKAFLSSKETFGGNLTGKLELKGKTDNMKTQTNLSINDLIYNGDTVGTVIFDAALKKRNLLINALSVQSSHGKLDLTGVYNTKSKDFMFNSNVDNFVMDEILARFNKNIKARVSGKISVKAENVQNPYKKKIIIQAHLINSHIKNLIVDSLNANVTVEHGLIIADKLDLYKNAEWLKLHGEWGDNKNLTISANHFSAPPVLELFGIANINGFLTMEGYYKETEGKREIKGNIVYSNPSYNNIRAQNIRASINYVIPQGHSDIEIRHIDILNTHLDNLKLSINSDSMVKTLSLSSKSKEINFNATVNLKKENSKLFILVDTLDFKYKKAEVKNRKILRLELTKDGLKLTDGELFLANIPIVTSFDVNKKWDYKILISADSLDLRTISDLLKIEKDVGGTLDFKLSGEGTLRNLALSLKLNIENFFLEEMYADRITGNLSYLNEEISITSLKILKGDETSEATGTIPLDVFRKEKNKNRKIDFVIIAKDLGDWVFYPFDKFCHYEGGKVYGTIRGNGTLGGIDLKGDLRLYSANFYIPFLGIRMKDTEAYFELSEHGIQIKKVHSTVEDGYLNLNGNMNFHGIKPETIDLKISGKHIPLKGFKDIYLTVNPEMKLQGPFTNLLLTGKVKIEKGDITIPFRGRREKGMRKGNFSYDVEVSAEGGDIWLKNEDVDVELSGKIYAKGTGNAPQLSGAFETKRGFIYYLDHTFSIDRGAFEFTNSPELNPEIDLLAQTKVHYTYSQDNDSKQQDTTTIVYLNVAGTMQEPSFSLTSQNSSLSEENIILLLSLNVTSLEGITSLANMSNLSDRAASYWIRQTLLHELQSSLGIDAIDLETKLLGPQKTAKLTVGKYISKDLYLGVTHDIFATSKDEFEIEYKILKRSYIVGKRNEEGNYNLGIKFKFKY